MATARQIAANRRNAERSKGPVTPEGREASRRNALKHGLAAEVLMTAEEADAVERRMAEWRPWYDLAGAGPNHDADFRRMILYSVRLDACRAEEVKLQRFEVERAERRWDEYRFAEAEALGKSLARRPAAVASQLEQTRQGVAWKIGRWRLLGELHEMQGEWTESQASEAFDLLGRPRALRPEIPSFADPAALVADETARLEGLNERALEALDERERAAACDGTPIEPSAAMLRLRRYEAACLRHYLRAEEQLRPHRRPSPARPTEPAPMPPEPETTPAPESLCPDPEPTGPSPAPERTRCEIGKEEPARPPVPAPKSATGPGDRGPIAPPSGAFDLLPRSRCEFVPLTVGRPA